VFGKPQKGFTIPSQINTFVSLKKLTMAVYRFRIVFEDDEDIYRDIDVQGKQNFEVLHRAIQEAIDFDGVKEASFYVSDDMWRKGREIALNPVQNDDDDDDDFRKPKKLPALKMSKTLIASIIDDPHQKFIYVYDPAVKWTLMIELMKIVEDDPKAVYPKCVKKGGIAPKQYKQVIAPPVDDEDDEEDEADKKAREMVFVVDEEYDGDEDALEGEEEDTDAVAADGDSEEGGEDAEEGGDDDFAPQFGDGEEEF
jgi:hypothetical protein